MQIDKKNQNSQNILIQLTRSTLNKLKSIDIIAPSLYECIFLNEAKDSGINLSEFSGITDTIDDNISTIEKYYKDITTTVNEVASGTEEAVLAIKNQDTFMLSKIHEKMLALELHLLHLKEEIYTDNLTKAKNRKWLEEKIITPDGKFCSDGILYFIDLDNFKIVNDTYGHPVGDQVLKHLVSFFKTYLSDFKDVDIIRYAGDEFLLLFKNLNFLKTNAIMKNLNEKFKKMKLKTRNGDTFNISFSFGGASFSRNSILLETLELADSNMYENKSYQKK